MARMKSFEQALDAVARKLHPEDMEATIFYARTVPVANAPPTDKTFANQVAAAEMMQPLFDKHPNHPGLAHYLIHRVRRATDRDEGRQGGTGPTPVSLLTRRTRSICRRTSSRASATGTNRSRRIRGPRVPSQTRTPAALHPVTTTWCTRSSSRDARARRQEDSRPRSREPSVRSLLRRTARLQLRRDVGALRARA